MKRRSVAVVIASMAFLTACGGAAEDTAEDVAGEAGEVAQDAGDAAGEAAEDATDAAGEAAEDATDAAGEAAGAAGTEGESTVLIGMVGTEEDREAFEISLTTEDGEEVTTLPAGDYTIRVEDPATMHNFHLVGGSVDETTSVPETEDVTWEVTLEEGEYTYVCDPHPRMMGSFTVTA